MKSLDSDSKKLKSRLKRGRVRQNLLWVDPDSEVLTLDTLMRFGLAKIEKGSLVWQTPLQDMSYFWFRAENDGLIYPISDAGLAKCIRINKDGRVMETSAASIKDARRRVHDLFVCPDEQLLRTPRIGLCPEVIQAVIAIKSSLRGNPAQTGVGD